MLMARDRSAEFGGPENDEPNWTKTEKARLENDGPGYMKVGKWKLANNDTVWIKATSRDYRGGATILRVGVQTLLGAKRAEMFFVVPHICMPFWGYNGSGVEQGIENWGSKTVGRKAPEKFLQLPPTNPVCPHTYWGHMTFLPLHPVETEQ